MHWIDIVLIAIIAIFALVGMKRGFVDAILSLFSTVVSIGIAIWASKPFAGFLEQCFKVTSFLSNNLNKMFCGWHDVFAQTATEATTGTAVINSANLGTIPELILKVVIGENCVIQAGETPASKFAEIIAPIALIVISAIIAFILIKLAVFLLSKLFDALLQNKALSGLDRTLGLLLGFVKGALVICVLMGITIFIPNDKIITEIDKTSITKVVYEPVTNFIRVNISDKLQQWAEDILPEDEETTETSYTVTFNNN